MDFAGKRLCSLLLTLAVGLTGSACQRIVSSRSPTPGSALPSVSPPTCQSGPAPAQPQLNGVHSASLTVPAQPFGLVYAPKGNVAFTVLQSALGVLSTDSGTPRLVRTVPLPAASLGKEGATGIALTHDGRELLIAAGSGAIVVDAAKAAASTAGAVLGTLTGTAGTSAIEVTVSPDDRYAFVSQEYGDAGTGHHGDIEVFDLRTAVRTGFGQASDIGDLPLGDAVVGTAISPDGRRLYATSEVAPDQTGSVDSKHGELSVIDLSTLESTPDKALLTSVAVGCQPVRVVAAPDGRTVWVTARGSNALLTFDAGRLTGDPQHALLASIQVGTAPVGLALVQGGSRVITADSDRFHTAGATTGLTVVDTQAALAGKPAVLGRIPTGAFPREFALSPDGKSLLVSDHDSNQIQEIDTATMP
ncbi:YncE family protein [Kitasatospora sp. GAS1066B]|uniref:YncE family protein n=1 Tax=Kitasatospora sp. GAS1066B TaxID=3156271 RepID=UPI003513F4C0